MPNTGQLRKKNKHQSLVDNPMASPKAKGERLRRIRHLANLSREGFCTDGEINLTTLISWEIGRFGGLSPKGAKRVIARVAKEGVFCTAEWLLYEIGTGPEVRSDYKKLHQKVEENFNANSSKEQHDNIIEELMLFRKLNKQAVDYIVEDDGMMPHYQQGDYVAGIKRFDEKVKSLTGLDCIIQTKDGRLIMRKLQPGPHHSTYNLVCTNLQTNIKDAIIYDVELFSAAPIIWHRRRDPAGS